MKFRGTIASILTAVIMCFCLTSCGGDDVIVGDDWRVSGVVVGDGTIIHDGIGVDVLVTISPESAAFYWNKPEQVLYDSVAFPMNIPDAEDSFNAISFNDIDGDGESDVLVSFINEDGDTTELVWIWDPVERYVFREELSSVTVAYGNLEDYVGLWEYVGENIWLRVNEDGSWEFVNSNEEVIEYGVLWVDETGLTLHFDGSGDVLMLTRTADGELTDEANGGFLVPTEGIALSDEPYFLKQGLELNAEPNDDMYLLKDGVCSYSGLGDGYNVDECYWEVAVNSDYTHDGIREIQFDAICYIPYGAIPEFNTEYITNTSSELYDYYTGMWFTAATAYNDTERGDNHYVHTLEFNGQSYQIEFSYSTEWQNDVGDWAKILTKSYMVYLSDDYDGLVFAAETQQDNYADCAKSAQLDSISPEASILDIELVDASRALFFGICR